MKKTGTEIRGEIKLLTTRLQASKNIFTNSLSYFEGEAKPSPKNEANSILELELELGKWQAAQKEFNVATRITFEDRSITLQEAINIVGGYSRLAKMWKEASGVKKKDRYAGYGEARRSVRNAAETVALAAISPEDSLKEYVKMEKLASELRTKIGIANNIEVDVKSLD